MKNVKIRENLDVKILSEDNNPFDYNFKVIILGDQNVGKSSLTNRAIKEEFRLDYIATVGFEFYLMNMKINDKIVRLQIWDTCGQEIYKSLIKNFYRGASVAFLVYAINYRESFNNIEGWIKEVKENSSPDVKFFLIGNKSDLESERTVTFKEGENLAKNFQMNFYSETSAKTGENARKIFIEAAKILFVEAEKNAKNGNRSVSLVNAAYNLHPSHKLESQNRKKKKNESKCC